MVQRIATIGAAVGLVLSSSACSSSDHPRGATTPSTVAATSSSVVLARDLTPVLRCPPHVPDTVHASGINGTGEQFVPGAPGELRACRYHGLNTPSPVGSFASSAPLQAAPVAAALNSAKPVGNVIPGCPNSDGQVVLLLFGYRNGGVLPVRVELEGCRFATNGAQMVFTPESVLVRLVSALGRDNVP